MNLNPNQALFDHCFYFPRIQLLSSPVSRRFLDAGGSDGEMLMSFLRRRFLPVSFDYDPSCHDGCLVRL